MALESTSIWMKPALWATQTLTESVGCLHRRVGLLCVHEDLPTANINHVSRMWKKSTGYLAELTEDILILNIILVCP